MVFLSSKDRFFSVKVIKLYFGKKSVNPPKFVGNVLLKSTYKYQWRKSRPIPPFWAGWMVGTIIRLRIFCTLSFFSSDLRHWRILIMKSTNRGNAQNYATSCNHARTKILLWTTFNLKHLILLYKYPLRWESLVIINYPKPALFSWNCRLVHGWTCALKSSITDY